MIGRGGMLRDILPDNFVSSFQILSMKLFSTGAVVLAATISALLPSVDFK